MQIIVAANHMSGKDTHVRGLRILGPIGYVPVSRIGAQVYSKDRRDIVHGDDPFSFQSPTFKRFETIR